MTELTDQPFDLDGRLESMFRDAPRLSADRVVAAALTDVSATPQTRTLFAIDATAFRVSLLAATIAALAIGLGLGLGPQLIGTDASPSPEASEESAAPSDLLDGYVRYRNEADGYEIVVPSTFQVVVEPGDGELREGVTRFSSDVRESFPSGLNVSVGSPDGTVYLCQGIACNPVVVTSIEELESAIQARWPSLEARRERIVATSLGGEAARLRHPTAASGVAWIGANQACSAYAMHGARPVVLTVACDGFSGGMPTNLATLERIVDSFRFLSSTPDAVGLRLYTNTELGFAVQVPEDWGEPQPAGAYLDDAGGAVGFVNPEGGLNRHSPVMYVSVGTPDGAVKLCNFAWECEAIVARTLDELIAAAEGIRDPEVLTAGVMGIRPVPVDEDTTLGGEPARYEGYEPFRGGTTIPWLEHVLTFHDGRPVIVGFDHYTFSTANPISTHRQAILESFRFLDGGASFVHPTAGFAFNFPEGWTGQLGRFSEMYAIGDVGSLNVFRGSDGRVRTCAQPAAFATWERCREVEVGNLQELASSLQPVGLVQLPAQGVPSMSEGQLTLDGEAAYRLTVNGGSYQVTYIAAFHDGEPIVLRFMRGGEMPPPEGWIAEVLDGFRFTD